MRRKSSGGLFFYIYIAIPNKTPIVTSKPNKNRSAIIHRSIFFLIPTITRKASTSEMIKAIKGAWIDI